MLPRRVTAFRLVVAVLTAYMLSACGAAAQTPSIDLNHPLQARVDAIMHGTTGAALVYDSRSHRVLAVTSPTLAFGRTMPPGSLMKLVTALALLHQNPQVAHETLHCANHLRLDGRDFTCGVQGGHGDVDLRAAIRQSCSIYFAAMSERLSAREIARAAQLLGLGETSPFVGGTTAVVRVPSSRRERALTCIGEGGSVRITLWDAIVMVTRLQTLAVQDDAARTIYDAMADVVRYGTGRPAHVAGLDVHGKTGTARSLSRTARPDEATPTHGWFACTAGHLSVAVFVEQGTGHDAAARSGLILKACAAGSGVLDQARRVTWWERFMHAP